MAMKTSVPNFIKLGNSLQEVMRLYYPLKSSKLTNKMYKNSPPAGNGATGIYIISICIPFAVRRLQDIVILHNLTNGFVSETIKNI